MQKTWLQVEESKDWAGLGFEIQGLADLGDLSFVRRKPHYSLPLDLGLGRRVSWESNPSQPYPVSRFVRTLMSIFPTNDLCFRPRLARPDTVLTFQDWHARCLVES